MKANKLLCLAAALIISCCAATGCQNSSSSDKDKSSSSSSSSSSDSSSNSSSDSSSSESTADSSNGDSSESGSSSSEERKTNAIGYDVKTSKRLYETLKEKYGTNGYDISMKSTVDTNSQHRLCIKGNKVLSTKKTNSANQTMIYNGGKTQEIFDHTEKTYIEQPVSNGASLVKKSDLLFGITGEFVEAKIDESNDVINEYYKINADITGRSGIIGYCFRGRNGVLAQITLEYDGSNVPVMFGIDSIKDCDDKVFNSKETYNYKKVD